MVKITSNNPFKAKELVVDAASIPEKAKREIAEFIKKDIVLNKVQQSQGKITVKVVTKEERAFKVIRDKEGKDKIEFSEKGKKEARSAIKKKEMSEEMLKYAVNEIYKKCVEKIEAFKAEHAGKDPKPAHKKHHHKKGH